MNINIENKLKSNLKNLYNFRIMLHEKSGNLIAADTKIIKIYNKDSGKIFTNI